MNHFPDHPFVREAIECPICGGSKRGGRIACGDCFQEIWGAGSDDQRAEAEERLDTAEEQHIQDNSQFGVGA